MSSNSIVPSSDQMLDPSYGSAPSVNVSQTPPQAVPAAPDDQGPVNGPSRLNSVLARIVGQPTPPPAVPSQVSGGQASGPDDADTNTASGNGGGWKSALGKVASIVSGGLSGVSDKGRPSFFSGLGEGARAENQAQATAQAIKFATFNDQVRAANLHSQDLQKQAADADQQKAQQAAEDFQNEALGNAGGSMDTHPNVGTSVMQTLQSQTAANGGATIAPGTHISANGKDINVPSNTPETLAAQVQNYKALQGKLPGLPGLPAFDPSSVRSQSDVTSARQALGQHLDIMQHLLQGFDVNGNPLSHQQLNDLIPAYQAQIDSLSKNGGATPYQIGTLKNTLAILQANEQNHSDKEQEVNDQATANAVSRQKQLTDIKTTGQEAIQNNAAGNKTQKPQNVDTNGNPVWVPGVSADEKKKAELSENVVYNSNNIASIISRRPDIVGAVAGRYTTLEQMAGTNDPDITALQQDMHNIAMANVGIHGMRSNDAVHDVEKNILNSFKNGPQAIGGALKAGANSVQTFIDNARPSTYKTHTNNGGALRSMVPQQGQQ